MTDTPQNLRIDHKAIMARAWELATLWFEDDVRRHGATEWQRPRVRLELEAPRLFAGPGLTPRLPEALHIAWSEAREAAALAANPSAAAAIADLNDRALAAKCSGSIENFRASFALDAEARALRKQIVGGAP